MKSAIAKFLDDALSRLPDLADAAGGLAAESRRRILRGPPREAPYAELQVATNFSFLRGASHPEEIVREAAEVGHRAVAITDRNTLAGVVRAHKAAIESGIRLIPGARLDLTDGPSLLCYPTDRAAYGRLSAERD